MFQSALKNAASSARRAKATGVPEMRASNCCEFVRANFKIYHTLPRVEMSSERNVGEKSMTNRRRDFHSVSSRYSGKMTDILVSSIDMYKTDLRAFGDSAFLINDTLVRQSVILLPQSFYLWDVKTFKDVTIDSLSLFAILHPTIEVLLLGCGKTAPQLCPQIRKHFQSKGILVEVGTTSHAASTFNILNQEGRNVAAALLTLEIPKRHDVENFDSAQFEEQAPGTTAR